MMKFLSVTMLVVIASQTSCTWVQRRGTPPAPQEIFDHNATAEFLRQTRESTDAQGTAFFVLTEGPRKTCHTWPVSSTLPDSVTKALGERIAELPFGTSGKPPKGVGLEVHLGDSVTLVTRHVTRTSPQWSNADEVADQLKRLAIFIPEFTRLHVWLAIKPNGLVRASYVERGSGNEFFDPRIVEILSMLRFAPCKADRVPVDCWIQFPVKINEQTHTTTTVQ